MTVLVLRCACCGLPWATLRDGTLEVASRHNGKIHVNRISVGTLTEVTTFGVSSDSDVPRGLDAWSADFRFPNPEDR